MMSSVHLEKIQYTKDAVEYGIIDNMNLIQNISNTVLSLRKSNNLRLRLPLEYIKIYCPDNLHDSLKSLKHILSEETNVKEVWFSPDIASVGNAVIDLNFKILAQNFPSEVQSLRTAIKDQKYKIVDNQTIEVNNKFIHQPCFTIRYVPHNNLSARFCAAINAIVEIDINPSESLLKEGFYRDAIREIQNFRKIHHFTPSEIIKIHITIYDEEIYNALIEYIEPIKSHCFLSECSIEFKEHTQKSHEEYKTNILIQHV